MGEQIDALDKAVSAALGCVDALRKLYFCWMSPLHHGDLPDALKALKRHFKVMQAVSGDVQRKLFGGRARWAAGRQVRACRVCEGTAWKTTYTLSGQVISLLRPRGEGDYVDFCVEALECRELTDDELINLKSEIESEKGWALLAPDAPGAPGGKPGEGGPGWWAPRDVAKKYELPQNALEARLRRWRKQNGEGWMEVPNTERKPRDAQFLYRLDAIKEVVNSMRGK